MNRSKFFLVFNRLFASSLTLFVVITGASFAYAQESGSGSGQNLVSNSSFESLNTNGEPTGWLKGRWGNNTAKFSVSSDAPSGKSSLGVVVSDRVSGDAKWYFNEISVSPGQLYEWSDQYKSNSKTYVTVQYRMNNDSLEYHDILNLDTSGDWKRASVRFLTPPNVKSLTIFHLLNNNGELKIAETNLLKVEKVSPTATSDNLIQNPSFEENQSADIPTGWGKGRWGDNSAKFLYPVSGNESNVAAQIVLSNRKTGDAKWYFPQIPVDEKATYRFEDMYKSNVENHVTAEFKQKDGSLKYLDLAHLESSSEWKKNNVEFVIPENVQSVSIFHLINKDGSLTVDNYLLKKITTTSGNGTGSTTPGTGSGGSAGFKGIISLTFDDGHKSTYDNVAPILEKDNIKSTHYIVGGRVGVQGFVGESEIKSLASGGNEIGAHTISHRDLTSLTEIELKNELEKPKADLAKIISSPINTFSYPFGLYNENVKAAVQSTGYTASVSSDGGINNNDNLDQYALKRISVRSNTSLDTLKNLMDSSASLNSWMIMTFHRVDDTISDFSIPVSKFQSIVDYAKNVGSKITTVSEGLSLLTSK